MSQVRVLCIRESFRWMGSHSGYGCLTDALATVPGVRLEIQEQMPEPGWLARRRLGKQYWSLKPSPLYSLASASTEEEAFKRLQKQGQELCHYLYLEQHFGMAGAEYRGTAKLVGTAHQPAGWWKLMYQRPENLKRLAGAIAVSRELATYLEPMVSGPVRYIPHGIDTRFFHPAEKILAGPPQLLMVGQWLRDFELLDTSLPAILAEHPEATVNLVVPRWRRGEAVMQRLARHRQVHWHCDLDDAALVKLYQEATLLMMPLLDCTANNAVLEAMACGLPIVSDRLPGLQDYVDDRFCTMTEPGDPDAFAEAVLKQLAKSGSEVAAERLAAREASLAFDWEQVAKETVAFYQEVAEA